MHMHSTANAAQMMGLRLIIPLNDSGTATSDGLLEPNAVV